MRTLEHTQLPGPRTRFECELCQHSFRDFTRPEVQLLAMAAHRDAHAEELSRSERI
ncbi:MAG: hypothetical protein KDC39_04455 [Actinobacteria bacterium]|nr:hypothetical protein [Actinomycetota bacterium]